MIGVVFNCSVGSLNTGLFVENLEVLLDVGLARVDEGVLVLGAEVLLVKADDLGRLEKEEFGVVFVVPLFETGNGVGITLDPNVFEVSRPRPPASINPCRTR